MSTFTVVLVLLVAVLASSFLLRASRLPIPLPLAQIAVGMLLGLIPSLRVEFDPQVFFLLFLPPLLFLDGWRIPKTDLLRDARMVLGLSLGLVAFTVIGMAFFLHWLVPAMPLAVAFALAAILSPTDPVAFSAVAAKAPIPKRMMHILEGESLLNDATGLVFFRFAVAAALTGAFSVTEGITTFLQLAIGGIAIGVGITYSIVRAKNWVSKRYGEEPGVQILISLLIPFAAYMAAEHVHCSGILAAVAAGITMGIAEFTGQSAMAITRIRRNAVWDTVQYTLNGFIFVLLGEQFPSILMDTTGILGLDHHPSLPELLLYVVIITTALIALRFLWVWGSFQLPMFRNAFGRRAEDKPSWQLITAMSLAGVRGAITLAGILSLPLFMNDGTLFPLRDFAIFIAAGVIVLSMLVATIALPYVLKDVKVMGEGGHRTRAERARRVSAHAAIRAIEEAQHKMAEGRSDADLYTEAAAHVMEHYRLRLERNAANRSNKKHQQKIESIERELILIALKAERAELNRMTRARKLDEDTTRRLIRELDLAEARFL
ncbi:MAG: Na+/H+ antiporter [Pseudomonas fluorescens]|nr:MAG: Na+/H+ antiporter [Pseudomonas fluorescens]